MDQSPRRRHASSNSNRAHPATLVFRGLTLPDPPSKFLNARELAAWQSALEKGLLEALRQQSGLFIIASKLAGKSAWICLYPPGSLGLAGAREWARRGGVFPTDEDQYFSFADVLRLSATSD